MEPFVHGEVVRGSWGQLRFREVDSCTKNAARIAGDQGKWDFDEQGEERWGSGESAYHFFNFFWVLVVDCKFVMQSNYWVTENKSGYFLCYSCLQG